MKYYSKPYADVLYREDIKAATVVWNGFVSFEQYKEIVEKAGEVLGKYKCQGWLSDMRNGKTVPKEAQEWVKKTFVPHAAKSGIKKAAFVLAQDVFRKMFADSIKNTISSHGIDLKYFEDIRDAENWITGK